MGDTDDPIGQLSQDLLRLAKELEDEEWIDKDAQNWYINGIHDSAHLMMLKWIDHEEHQPPTAGNH